jgi:NAD+ diphosphatase
MLPSLPQRLPQRLPVWRTEVDRDAATRTRPDAIETLLADPATRVVVVRRGSALANVSGLRLVPIAELPQLTLETADAVAYLGRSLATSAAEPVGTPIIAVAVSQEAADALADPAEWGTLRTLGGTLGHRDRELLAQAAALLNWHDSHGFSPRTGAATTVGQAGWVRRADEPAHEVYPRIDPSVIVAVLDDDDRILLGSNAQWESNRFSLLAGFVEPGESLEAAVEREVFEESGIRVTDAHYVGSQPWPMPASLMLGFIARVDPAQDSTLAPDGEEILALRWFSREELLAAREEIILPNRSSIARAIIELWYGGPLEDSTAVARPR